MNLIDSLKEMSGVTSVDIGKLNRRVRPIHRSEIKYDGRIKQFYQALAEWGNKIQRIDMEEKR